MRAFFRDRWNGDVSLATLLWRDMAFVGTAINLGMTGLALLLLGAKTHLAIVLALHLLPAPYNIFLTAAIWRTAEKIGGTGAWFATLAATLWLIATFFI